MNDFIPLPLDLAIDQAVQRLREDGSAQQQSEADKLKERQQLYENFCAEIRTILVRAGMDNSTIEFSAFTGNEQRQELRCEFFVQGYRFAISTDHNLASLFLIPDNDAPPSKVEIFAFQPTADSLLPQFTPMNVRQRIIDAVAQRLYQREQQGLPKDPFGQS